MNIDLSTRTFRWERVAHMTAPGAIESPGEEFICDSNDCRKRILWNRAFALIETTPGNESPLGVYCYRCAARACDPDCLCPVCIDDATVDKSALRVA